MKIHRTGDMPSPEPAGPEAAARKRPEAQAPAGDSVRLSGASRELAEASQAGSAFDPQKVEAVKAAIANGSFRVDTGKVADALIASVADLLGRKTQ
ncbi:MAG: flagellar biosynthesis anti-sigma factor FlgM [Betaproteobacteria bacterium]|nr:flagellar biosynthesis anti-sigma factor FlgM [Betaproteobacteria bacterium]